MQIVLNRDRWQRYVFVLGLFQSLFWIQPAMAADNANGLKPLPHFKDCDQCSEMVVLPAGQFMMGATDDDTKGGDEQDKLISQESETPRHLVHVKSFALAKFDVTREQFALFAMFTRFESKGCQIYANTPPDYIKIFGKKNWFSPAYANWERPGFNQTELDPVVCVSWNDAQQYIAWLNSTVGKETGHHYRLPTEAEWEYAARAGTDTPNYWGGVGSPSQCKYANAKDLSAKDINPEYPYANCDDGYRNTSPVGSFLPNAWGLYDMLGDVEQWTQDCWHENYADSLATGPALGPGNCSNRELRGGGGWIGPPFGTRTSLREIAVPDYRKSQIGFRLAADIVNLGE